MDKKRALTNIFVGMAFKIVLLILSVISKSFVVKYLGDEANGLYTLYISILGFLSIANLGIGTAIAFSMYKPIVDNNRDAISALYFLYKKFYITVFFIITILGVLLVPIIPHLAKGSTNNKTIYLTYVIFLISVSATYLYAHKTSFINAHKDNYVTTLITSSSSLIESIIQIIILVTTKNFVYFLAVRLLTTSLIWLITTIVFKFKYSHLVNGFKKIDVEIKKEIIKNSKAMMFYKVGENLSNTFDGIIISSIVGVVALGLYSNYIIIAEGLIMLLYLIFTEITSIIGQLYAKQSKLEYYNQFKKTYIINFIVGLIFFMGYIAISSDIVGLLFGEDKKSGEIFVIIIGVNYFLQFMRRSIILFKTASGGFYHDRYRPLIEGLFNVILSFILVVNFGINGVLIATIISQLIITYYYETKILFRYSFNKEPGRFYIIHYSTALIFLITALIYNLIPLPSFSNIFLSILVNGTSSVLVSIIVTLIIFILYKDFRKLLIQIFKTSIKPLFKK